MLLLSFRNGRTLKKANNDNSVNTHAQWREGSERQHHHQLTFKHLCSTFAQHYCFRILNYVMYTLFIHIVTKLLNEREGGIQS